MADLTEDLAALRIDRTPEPGGNRRWVVWFILVVILLAGAAAAWRFLVADRPVAVEAATVTERAAGAQAAVLNASGYVTARRRATVSSKITGKVVEVDVDEGLAVKEGQVLARLDDATVKAALALAQAQLAASESSLRENQVRRDQARVTYARDQQLFKDGAGTQIDVDSSKADLDSFAARIVVGQEDVNVAKAQVASQETEVDNTIIRAPFSGVVTTKDAQPGEMVSPVSAGGGFTRTGICTVVDMHSLEIEVDVNESYINRVKPDQDVTAVLNAYPDWQIPARVITIVPTADREKATVLVRIAFKQLDPRILPDMGVKVTFLADNAPTTAAAARPAVIVSKDAVVTDNGQTFAFIIHGDTVERRAIRVGGADGGDLEILAGLHGGDRVVVSPPATLTDGARVVVK